MKPFNLQEAIAGKPVITKDGKEVTQLTFFTGVTGDKYEIAGMLDGAIATWTRDGVYFAEDNWGEDERDLHMKTERKEVYLNIYPDGFVRAHATKEAAERTCEPNGRTVTGYYED